MKTSHYRLLAALLSRPTAPFREDRVAGFVRATLAAARVPHFTDPAGNIVVGCASAAEYRRRVHTRSREPLRVFIAHMDHPGFHGWRWSAPGRMAVRWHGGSPVKHLTGARVWLADDAGRFAHGRMTRATLARTGHGIAAAEINAGADWHAIPAQRIFGGFDFGRPRRRGERIFANAADDLVGVYAILRTAISLRRRAAAGFIGLLTRAEEVGFVGALAHLELGWLENAHRPLLAISLESSRTLPGAVIGKGPVVRLGDRRTVFDADNLQVLTDLAARVLPKKHQRRIMDGGSCEAAAATAYGIPAIGISVPLGNYHNQGLESGTRRNGPAPEFVHLDDIEGTVALCEALMHAGLPWQHPWTAQRRRLRKNLSKYRRLLRR
jgi:putative aminopeptidase FrvX